MELEREILAFCAHIEALLGGDTKYETLWKEPSKLLEYLRDGLLLGDIVHAIRPECINLTKIKRNVDISKINKSKSAHVHEIYNNLNICLSSIQSIGIKLVNTGPEDFIEMHAHIVLGVIWQLVRMSLMTTVNLEDHPELVRLLNQGEKLQQLIDLSGEKLLLRWVNYHLQNEDSKAKPVSAFKQLSIDHLMSLMLQVVPRKLETTIKARVKASRRLSCTSKAQFAVDCAELLACRKFIGVATLVNGDQRLMHAFVATLFNQHIGIHLPSEVEIRDMVYRISVLTEEVVRLRKRLETAEANNSVVVHLQSELTEVREELKMADTEAVATEKELDNYKNLVSAKEDEVASLQETLLTARAGLGRATDKVKDLQCTVPSLLQENERMRKDGEVMQATISRLEEEKTKSQRIFRETRGQGIQYKNKMIRMEDAVDKACNSIATHLCVPRQQKDDETAEESLIHLVSQLVGHAGRVKAESDGVASENQSLKMRQEILLDKVAAIAEAQLNEQRHHTESHLTPLKMFAKWSNSVGKGAKSATGSLRRRSKREPKSVKQISFEPPAPRHKEEQADSATAACTEPVGPKPRGGDQRNSNSTSTLRGARPLPQAIASDSRAPAVTTPLRAQYQQAPEAVVEEGSVGGGGAPVDSPPTAGKRVSFARTRSNSSPGRMASPGRIELQSKEWASHEMPTSAMAKSIMERAMQRAQEAIEAPVAAASSPEHACHSPTASEKSFTGTGMQQHPIVVDENSAHVLNMGHMKAISPVADGLKDSCFEDDDGFNGAASSAACPKRRRRRPLRTQQV